MITCISSCGAFVNYDSDLDVYEYLHKNKKTIEIPSMEIYREKIGDYEVKYRNSSTQSITCNEKTIFISYPIDKINEETIVYPATVLLERQYHELNESTFHSACIEKDGSGILLIGKTGSGKTTTALNLCINYDYFLVSNDKTLLKYNNDGLVAVDGPKFIFLRYESLKRNLPFLLPIFDGKKLDRNYIDGNHHNIDNWLRKIRIQPEELGIKTASEAVPIKEVYLLHIDESQEELVVRSANNLASILLINENLNKTIRSVEMSVKDKNYQPIGYIPSYDDPNFFDFKNGITNLILNDLSIKYISGNIRLVSEYIDEVHKQKIK